MPISIAHAKALTIAAMTGTVTLFNASGNTTTGAATDLVLPTDWNSAHSVTLSLSDSEIAGLFNFGGGLSSTTAAGGITAGIANMSYFEPFPSLNTNSTLSTLAIGSWYFDPVELPFGMASGRIIVLRVGDASQFLNGVSMSNNSLGAFSKVGSFRHCLAFYSRGAGANSTRLESVWTGEAAQSATHYVTFASTNATCCQCTAYLTMGFISQVNTAGGMTSNAYTVSGTVTTGMPSMVSSGIDTALTSASSNRAFFTGSMLDVIPFNTSLPAGMYWLAHMFTTHVSGSTSGANYTSAGTHFGSKVSVVHQLDLAALSAFKALGQSTIGNTSSCAVPWHGALKTVSSNATGVLATSDMAAGSSNARLYWNFIQDQFG